MGHCKVPDCPGSTEYDDNAQAVLCTTCGTVTTQDILTHDWDGEFSGSSLYFGPSTLKSLRRAGGVLAGQSSKDDRDRRNTTAMHQYILGLLTKLACSGLTPRAQTLFEQARARGKYRWGKKAVLAAGACIAVVLRESKKGVMMTHIASLMDVSPHSLCRVFTQINTLLGLQLPPFDPLSLLPSLQSHLTILISSPTCPLPQAMVKLLEPLPAAPVLRLATSLATLLNHLDDFSSSDPSPSPTACALFILALEGQAAASLPSYATLAQELGRKVGTRKALVVDYYRDISQVLEEWIAVVPWISGTDHPDNRLGKKRRKTSRRDVIAMGLKDVVQFQEEIFTARKARETESPVIVSLEIAEDEEGSDYSAECSTPATGQKRKRSESSEGSVTSSKFIRLTRSRKSRSLTRLDLASLSLLSPSHPLASDTHWTKKVEHMSEVDALQTQILASPVFPLGLTPSRLQQLAVLRGGEGEIKDDELFEEGELEGLLRSDAEVDKLRDFFGWDEQDADPATFREATRPSAQGFDWDPTDLAAWEDLGGEKGKEQTQAFDVNEQVLGEWREASPLEGTGEGDRFDIRGEW